jgi:hypothetical protein
MALRRRRADRGELIMTGRTAARVVVLALAALALAGCSARAVGTVVAPAPAGASASAHGVATAPPATVTPAPDLTQAQRDAEAQAARFVTAATASCAAVGGVVVGDDLSGSLYCQSGRFTPSGRCGMWAAFDLDGTINARDRSYSPGCWTRG